MTRALKVWTDWFVLWVLVFSALAHLAPGLFAWFRPYIVPGLGITMFGMGMTLVPDDFRRVARMPRAVLCGVLGQFLPVDRWGLFASVVKMVLIPVASGFAVRFWLKDRATHLLEVFPAISVLFIVVIIACIVALTREKLGSALGMVGVLVVAHNALGFGLGYGLAALFRLPPTAGRTVALEVGMQNSGLGVTLAAAHFANPLVALPASLFSVVHNLTGSALATLWRKHDTGEEPPSDN